MNLETFSMADVAGMIETLCTLSFYSGFIVISVCMCFFVVFYFLFFSCVLLYEFDIK